MICPACKCSISQGEQTAKFSIGVCAFGQKSQRYYHEPELENEIVIHYKCIFLFFNPFSDKEMYEHFYVRVENQVTNEKFEELKEMAFSEVANDIRTLCAECRESRNRIDQEVEDDADVPPEIYTCDSCGTNAPPICSHCNEIVEIDGLDPEALAVAANS